MFKVTKEGKKTKLWADHFKGALNQPSPATRPKIHHHQQYSQNCLPVDTSPPTKAEILNTIKLLKSGKIAGPNGIPPEALKTTPEITADVLTSLMPKDSRKTTVSNGPQSTVSQPAQSVVSEPGVAVVEQLHAGGDKLASLCLAAVGNATQQQHTADGSTKPISLGDSMHKSKTDLARSPGSRLELTNIESGGGGGGADDHAGGHGHDPALNRTGR
ncbi:unnamed protein product [Trichobilharzia regenti]|nr:unnamed protein product [Trichobilharzia regenti]